MNALWPIALSTTLLPGLATMDAVASPAPRVTDLAPTTLTQPQQQQVDSLRQRYRCPPDNSDALAQLAALRQCLSDGSASAADLQYVQQLYVELAAEQGQLQSRVSAVAADFQTLAEQQFSTTARLEGEAVFALLAASGAGRADDPDDPIDSNLAFGYRARLNVVASFTGDDQLRLRLQARDIAELEDATGTQMANLGFDGGPGETLELSRLEYETPLTDNLEVLFQITGGGLGDFVPAVNPLFSGSGDGSISTFGRENPIRRLGGAPGLGLSYDLTDWANLSAAVLTPDAYETDVGLFEEQFSAIAQLTLRPSDTTGLAFTYVRTYNSLGTGTGSELGEDPFDGDSDAVATHAIGAEVAWDLSSQLTLSGRVGYLWATAQDLDNQPTAELFTWAASLGLRDLGTEGSLGGLIVGTPPRVLSNAFDADAIDPNAALHLEAFYRWPVNEYLALTPSLIVVINPEHDSDNPTLYIGTIRATFTF
ncbi:iron uptake porin [Leptolyngbya sp. KIOST-1]|uniref:iron uptake porin n=1 Tax=Leptolyngbya sp. KIOST-1 TaxID=1229172 RepID=UPI000A528E65|nr:iron uptake porin [Leptolyngbya sp. KIOST-1]